MQSYPKISPKIKAGSQYSVISGITEAVTYSLGMYQDQ